MLDFEIVSTKAAKIAHNQLLVGFSKLTKALTLKQHSMMVILPSCKFHWLTAPEFGQFVLNCRGQIDGQHFSMVAVVEPPDLSAFAPLATHVPYCMYHKAIQDGQRKVENGPQFQ